MEKGAFYMKLCCSAERRRLTVRLEGEIDHHAARKTMLELNREIESRFPKVLILDMSGVSFMDSSGIAVLLRTCRRMQEINGAMQVVGVPPQSGKVLRAANLQKAIPIAFAEKV